MNMSPPVSGLKATPGRERREAGSKNSNFGKPMEATLTIN
jgi:hypothetical protein